MWVQIDFSCRSAVFLRYYDDNITFGRDIHNVNFSVWGG